MPAHKKEHTTPEEKQSRATESSVPNLPAPEAFQGKQSCCKRGERVMAIYFVTETMSKAPKRKRIIARNLGFCCSFFRNMPFPDTFRRARAASAS